MIFRWATLVLALSALLISTDVQSQSDFYRQRNSYYKYRYGKSVKRYKRACSIIRRHQKNNDRFMSRLFRRRSAGGEMQTE